MKCPYGVACKASALGAGNDIPKPAYCDPYLLVLLANRVAAACGAPTTREGEASGRRRSSMTLPPSEDLGRRLSSMLLPAAPPPLDGLWLAHCHIGDKAVRCRLTLSNPR